MRLVQDDEIKQGEFIGSNILIQETGEPRSGVVLLFIFEIGRWAKSLKAGDADERVIEVPLCKVLDLFEQLFGRDNFPSNVEALLQITALFLTEHCRTYDWQTTCILTSL